MSCDKCNHKNLETQYIGDVAIDALADLPEYLLAERDVEDELSGDTVRSLVRIPTKRIVPNGNLDNVFTVADSDAIEIPEGQVRGGRITNQGSYYETQYSDLEGEPMFIMIGKLGGKILAQSCGVINITCGHDYVIGQQYYGGALGEPTTDDASGTAVKLFIPISKTQLLVNI